MSIDIRKGEHKLGWAEGATPFRDGESFDIGGTAQVELHGKTRVLFIWGNAVVDLYAEVAEEVWIWGGTLRLHVKCNVRQSGGVVHSNGTGSTVTVEKHGACHAQPGDTIRGYGEARIYAPTGTSVSLCGYAQHHLPDGTVRGNTDTYRGGYCLYGR